MEGWLMVACGQALIALCLIVILRKWRDDQIDAHEQDRKWMQSQFDALVKVISRRVSGLAEVVDQGTVETLHAYHEMRLMPALTLLASQRVDCAPPPDEVKKEEAAPARSTRVQLQEDEIQNIWDKVKATP